jgi:hypothetical protein
MFAADRGPLGVTLGVTLKAYKRSDPQMPLTDAAIRAAKPRPTQYKLFDEAVLFGIVKPAGGRL